MDGRYRDEQGIAMITSILIGVIVLTLSLIAVSLTDHNLGAIRTDRKRVFSVQAAEAGLDAVTRLIATKGFTDPDFPCGTLAPVELTGTAPTTARYTVTAVYYDDYPAPTGAVPMACPLSTDPAGVVLTSVGDTSDPVGGRRTMQLQARISPIYGGFQQALFSNSTLNLQNNSTVRGNGSSDGDVYTNGDLTCFNHVTVLGTVFSQGQIAFGNCTTDNDLYARRGVSLNGGQVGNDAKTSDAGFDVTLAGAARVSHDVFSARNCVGCQITGNQRNVWGTVRTNALVPPPLAVAFPVITWGYWAGPPEYEGLHSWMVTKPVSEGGGGYTLTSFSGAGSAALAKVALGSQVWNGDNVIRVADTSAKLNLAHTHVRFRGGNLVIVADGGIEMPQGAKFTNTDSDPRALVLVVPYEQSLEATGQPCPSIDANPNRSIRTGQSAEFNNVRTFAYSPCDVDFGNNNMGLGGQIFAGRALIANNFELNYSPVLLPGIGRISGHNVDIAYKREVINS